MSNSLKQAQDKLSSKYPNIKLIEYNGYFNEAKFFDLDYGEFTGIYQCVYSGSRKHPSRVSIEKNNRLFKSASDLLKSKHPHLKLIEYSTRSTPCKVHDDKYGEFYGIYNNILLGKKKHKARILNERFFNAQKNLLEKFPYYTLISYSGVNSIATVLDVDFGEFSAKYSRILSGLDLHPNRQLKIDNDRFEDYKRKIKNNFPYLTLIEFNNDDSVFLDDEYGEFKGNYYKVLNGSKRHPERAKKNKIAASKKDDVKEKRKKTCLKKYGKKTPLLTFESVYNFNGKTAFDVYKESNLSFSYTTFLRLLKTVGLEHALKSDAHKTSLEFTIQQILIDLNVRFDFNKCFHDSKYRPDFVLHDHKLIIETDGLYYHSELNKEKHYHRDKKDLYTKYGYRSLFFRSDEVMVKTDIVNSIIRYHLNKADVIYARKCSINKGRSRDFSDWFYRNHLMGNGSGEVYYLTHEGRTVSAMSIIKRKNEIEISRFCNDLNTTVVGGFSKLLKQVIKDYNPEKIVSFVDCRYGTGSSLLKSGFVEVSKHLSFRWTNFSRTFHRMKFPGNTGYDNNMVKIWDCGQKKFVKKD